MKSVALVSSLLLCVSIALSETNPADSEAGAPSAPTVPAAGGPSTTLGTLVSGGESLAGLPNFRRVNDNLFRGGQPTSAGLAELKKLGVRAIVNLRDADTVASDEAQQALALGIHYYSIPMRNLVGPTQAEIDKALGILDDSQNWPVYVHCRRGKDRTGTVIACYRIKKDSWTADKAIAEALDAGMAKLEFLKRAFIRGFGQSWLAASAAAGVKSAGALASASPASAGSSPPPAASAIRSPAPAAAR